MHYYIDGYNVTRRDPATRDLPLEEQREHLERRLRADTGALLGKSFTIIWDGAGGEGIAGSTSRALTHSEFTRMPTADDAIVDKVRRASMRVGVVTSDRELANRCKSAAQHGVEILPSDRLFASAPKKKRTSRKPMRRDIGIPSNANEINRELKEIWGIED